MSSTVASQPRRSTRQQSRDPDPPASPPKQRGRPRANRSNSANVDPLMQDLPNTAAAAQNLTTIPEASHGLEQLNVDQSAFDPVLAENSPETTLSHHQIAHLLGDNNTTREELPSYLVELHGRSNSLLHKLVSKLRDTNDLAALVQLYNSARAPQHRIFHAAVSNFKETRARFTSDPYIQPSIIIRASLNTVDNADISQGPWRPDAILQKANLATLADELFRMGERVQAIDILTHMDNVFPVPFVNSFDSKSSKKISAGASKKIEPSFKFLLEIRTQVAVCRLQQLLEETQAGQTSEFGPSERIQQTFREANGEIRRCGIDFTSRYGCYTNDQKKTMELRAMEIEHAIAPGGVGLEALDAEFPWPKFKLKALDWIRERDTEIENQIRDFKNPDEIAERWEQYMQNQQDPQDMPEQTQSGSAQTVGKTYLSGRSRRASRRGADDQDYMPAATGEEGDVLPQDQSSGFLGRGARGDIDSSVPVDPVLVGLRNDANAEVQRRRFADPQPGAQKIPWESQNEVPTPTHGTKRPRPEDDMEQELSQDAGFQADDRGTADADQRRAQMDAQHIEHAELAYAQLQANDQAVSTQTHEPYPTGNYEEPPEFSQQPERTPAEQYQAAQEMSKRMTAHNSKNRLPQQRKGWTLEETNALIKGIEMHKNGYAQIKKVDAETANVFVDRDAEGLRHKARNMKFDYLKAGVPLPPGFDHVLLDKKFREKLDALNVPYVQDQARRRPTKILRTGDE